MTEQQKGYQRLSKAIINNALSDLRKKDEFAVYDAWRFFLDDWYQVNALYSGKDMNRINKKVMHLVNGKVSDAELKLFKEIAC